MNQNTELIDAVIEKAVEADGKKKLNCADAFELAERFNVKIIEIGRICNRNKIRIGKCQLGCFR